MQISAMVAIALLHRRLADLAFAMVFAAGLLLTSAAQGQQPTTSLLLVARPQIKDPFFAESVVLVTRHGRSRPMGVILNKPTQTRSGLADGEAEKPEAGAQTLFIGGPVSPRVTVYIYKDPEAGKPGGRKDVLDLGDGLFMGMGGALAKQLLERQPAIELKVFRGFSSWAHGQLEREISRGDWLVLPFEAELALRADVAGLWEELIARASRRRI